MSVPVRLRHPLVVLGVVLSLLAGAATIRAAAAWTAASSPLAVKPPSVEQLQSDLTAERARSVDLQLQLEQLSAGSRDLVTAIEAARTRIAAARTRIAADAAQARALQESLAAAKDKLATLERTIREARAAAAAAIKQAPPTTIGTPATLVAAGDREVDQRDHEEWDDDD